MDIATDEIPILPGNVPVEMPALPPRLIITLPQQFRAAHDPTRIRILGMILHQPMTAKQIADGLQIPHGTIGHHLQILEETGLAQVVARRSVRNMIAKYYTRTARLFDYNIPPEITGSESVSLDIITQVRDEMAEAIDMVDPTDITPVVGVVHIRLSPEQVALFHTRLTTLLDDFSKESPAENGIVYGLCGAFFVAPQYQQGLVETSTTNAPVSMKDEENQ